jgi:hypothetical protein
MSKRRPTIYIGLGGTGIKAIAHAKKLYEEEFGVGNIPKEIAFLAIDFDAKEVEKPDHPTNLRNDFLVLRTPTNPRDFYNVQHDQYNQFNWMFKSNTGFIAKAINDGASQVRTTGRLYTDMVTREILSEFVRKLNTVQSITQNAHNQNVDVHLVMSLAGGTGAGSFLTVALLLHRDFGQKINLYGYGVLHGVFRAMDVTGTMTPRVVANAYSAIMDLDYILHASIDNPVNVALGASNHKITDGIFEEFYVVNNETQDGKVVNDVRQLSEVIGTSLYVSSNDLGNEKSSIANNMNWKVSDRFNVQTKRGWVYGLGACQVVYKGAQLAQVFALKASRELMRQMQAVGDDAQQMAINWTEEVDIREDGEEYNRLTDRIYDHSAITKIKLPLLSVDDTDNANKTEVNKYLSALQPEFPDAQAEEKIKKDLIDKLDEKISTIVNNTNGIGNAISFLSNLKKLCEGYKGEMETEEKSINQGIEKDKEILETKAWKDYNDAKKGFFTFNKDSKNQDLLEDLVGRLAQKIKKQIHEAKRRNVAYNVYVTLLGKIDELINKVELLSQSLKQIDSKFENELLSMQRTTASSLVFEYDLSYKERVNLSVSKDEVNVPLFINELQKSLQKSLLNVELEDLEKIFIDYTLTLPRADEYRNRLINDVIRDLSDEDYAKLKDEIESKSSLLLRIDDRGQTIEGYPVRNRMLSSYMIATYSDEKDKKSRLEEDDYFNKSKKWVKSSAEVLKQKIIFYRVDGAILPYCIEAFDPYTVSSEYETQVKAAMASGSTKFNPHFDAGIFEDMIKNDFKLKPEMKNEALFYWVCGQIFGWTEIPEEEKEMRRDEKGMVIGEDKNAEIQIVKHPKYIANIKKKYYYWDEEAMEGNMQKWQPIDGAGTSRRDKAYNYFKSIILPQKKELFNALIKQEFSKKGNEYWRLKIEQIANSGIEEYINCLLCSNKISTTYFQDNGGEIQVIKEEFDFIQKQLYTVLSTLK